MKKKDSYDQIIANQVAGMPIEEAVYQAGYSAGHDIGYERGKREAAQQGAVWVKASTRLPASWHLKCVRFIHTRLPLLDTEAFLEHNPKNVDLIEWLDESGQSQPEMAE